MNWEIIGLGNGLAPNRHDGITWSKAEFSAIRPWVSISQWNFNHNTELCIHWKCHLQNVGHFCQWNTNWVQHSEDMQYDPICIVHDTYTHTLQPNIGSSNGLSPVWQQAITRNNAFLSFETFMPNFYFVIGWSKHKLGLPQLQWNLSRHNRCEFPLFSKATVSPLTQS